MINTDKERFLLRLSQIPGLSPGSSHGNWILCEVNNPELVARLVAKKLETKLVHVSRYVQGMIRIYISDNVTNERLITILTDALKR